MDILFSSNN